mgnify:FL=1|tara:strand:+ start:148 stop:354 length:207 start_codon:yes stop_codon:yes gene_type:complete
MKYTNCIFNWSDNPEPCKNKPKYKGDVYGEPDERGVSVVPMIGFYFCEEHYKARLNQTDYKFKNVEKL